MNIEQVLETIKRERAYQDKKWGTPEQNPHLLTEWLILMQEELQEAWDALERCSGNDTLREILQAVAVGVACLEQYGVVERDEAGR